MKSKYFSIGIAVLACLTLGAAADKGCGGGVTADMKDQAQQEGLAQEAQRQTGMPSITRFQERKLLKMLYEMRDQEKLQTWTYLQAEMTGKLVFLGRSVGYGMPYATQYSNPQKIDQSGSYYRGLVPQAEPNDLFPPSSADGTWVFLQGPNGEIEPVYIEPKIVVSPFPLAIQ